jgi:hypothetical protein
MIDFIRQRGVSLALVIGVLALCGVTLGSISYTLAFGALRGPLGMNLAALAEAFR